MSSPTRQTAGGRAYLDLQNRARREQRTTQELLVLYVLERWLARMAASPYRDHFVLKGGILLQALDARRPTVDADLLASHIANDVAAVSAHVRDIARIVFEEDDGVDFLPDTLVAQPIRAEALYAGVRLNMDTHIATADVKFRLDINVGDPVTPAPTLVWLPSQRPGYPAIAVLGYPIETVLAEKVGTAIALGEANTRIRDFADAYTLTGRFPVAFNTMRAALAATLGYRRVDVAPLSQVVGALAVLRTRSYRAYKRRLGPDGAHLPNDFSQVLAALIAFADPLADGDPSDAVWDPAQRMWHEPPHRVVSV